MRNKTHNGNVRITADNQDKMLKLLARTTHIGGDLSIDSNVHADLPALTSLGGYLFINSNVQLPALTSLGGDPSTDREYWLDASSATRATLNGIKLELWGLPDNLEWTRMW